MVQDTSIIKNKILSFLRTRGPSLPVHVSTDIKSTILFTSAFLSELVSEKKVKISNMRVGSSPIYFIPGQEQLLERFSDNLKSKEKEAFLLLKEKKFLRDSIQHPAIRVALREIKDFALPFRDNEEIMWRYFLIPESDFNRTPKSKENLKEDKKQEEKKQEKPKEEEPEKPKEEAKDKKEKQLDIFSKTKEKKKTPRKKTQQNNKFLDKIKKFLSEKQIELKDIESFTKSEIILRVLENSQEKILVAYNKRSVSENDIIKAYKKISDKGLPSILLCLGGPSKKISELMKAMQGISAIEGVR